MTLDPAQRFTLRISDMFAVPCGMTQMADCNALNAELRALFLSREAEGRTYANPRPLTQRNPQTFESHFDLFRWPEPCVQRLKDFCWAHLLNFVGALQGYDRATCERLLIYNDAWFHIMRRGAFFGLHNHPMASWSGVYSVHAAPSDANKPDSGLLCFVNPCVTSAMYMDSANNMLRPPFDVGFRTFRLEPGQLVLFPSWLLHDVKPYEGDGERITVAFNCWFSMPAPSSAAAH
jgi:uncharacterized protein (TIGR02466 family)